MRWIVAAVFAFFFAPSAAQAWGQGGHYTVCEIAYLNLEPGAKAEVDRLVALHGLYASFTESCVFADSPPTRPSEHFANYPRDLTRVSGPGCPGGRPCVLSAIQSDLAILRSSAPDPERALALIYLGHWFGDLHQPLHISFADDRGGNSIGVLGECRFSLHSVWDTCIAEGRILKPGKDRLTRARAAAAELNASLEPAQRSAWLAGGPGDWANESFQIATDPATGYCVRRPDGCWSSESSVANDAAAKRVINVDDAYLDRAAPIVAERLLKAGLRLADALNRSFGAAAGPEPVPPAPADTPAPTPPPADETAATPTGKAYLIHAIDVGTGLSIFVEGADFTLLYDAGSNDDVARGDHNRVLAYLRAVRPDLKRIDHLILSHPHKDHSELMPDVVDAYEIGNLWDSGALHPICSYRLLLEKIAVEAGAVYHHATSETGAHSAAFPAAKCYGRQLPAAAVSIPRSVRIGSAPIPLGAGASMTVLHADGTTHKNVNENSLVIRVDLGARRILLPGDAEAGGRADPSTRPAPGSVERELLDEHLGALKADILVAPHHGSTTSSRTEFLEAVAASNYIVSAGPTHYSGIVLPDMEVIKEYLKRGAVWRTDVNDIGCQINPSKIGPDADGRPGGCDNIIIKIDESGSLSVDTDRRPD